MKTESLKFRIVVALITNVPITLAMIITAQLVANGTITFQASVMNFLVGYAVAFVIGVWIPLVKWGAGFAKKYGAKPNTLAFGLLLNLVVNTGYALLCSIVMTWFNVCLLGGQPFVPEFFLAFAGSFVPIWLVSYVVSFLCNSPCRKLAEKLCETNKYMEATK